MKRPTCEPAWLPRDSRDRFGAGLEISCPVHVGCRLAFWFSNPLDGHEPLHSGQLYFQEGSGLGCISLWPLNADGDTLAMSPMLEMGEHGTFAILKGCLVFPLQ